MVLSFRMKFFEICGVRELQKYLVNQVQEVYRLQGVDINDKHIEIIVRQMLKKVRVIDPGDTSLLYGEEVDKKEFERENIKVAKRRRKSCPRQHRFSWVLQKLLLAPNRLFRQHPSKIQHVFLTEAACAGKTDYLLGFKENVIMGHIIPGGTGFERHRRVKKFVDRELEEELVFDFETVPAAPAA